MRKRSKSLPITIPGKDEELRKERMETRRAIFSFPFITMPTKPLLQALFEMSDSEDEETSSETSTEDNTESSDDSQFSETVFEIEIEDKTK